MFQRGGSLDEVVVFLEQVSVFHREVVVLLVRSFQLGRRDAVVERFLECRHFKRGHLLPQRRRSLQTSVHSILCLKAVLQKHSAFHKSMN